MESLLRQKFLSFFRIKIMSSKAIEIIIIGTGAYVCGKYDDEFGTILPSLFVYVQKFKIKIKLIVAYNSKKGKERILNKFYTLSKLMKTEELLEIETINCKGRPEVFFSNFSSESKNLGSIVSIPDQLHYHWIKKLLLNKIPVLTVKPLTLNFREAIELKNLSEKYKIPSFVEFHKRYDKQIRYAKDRFLSKRFGDLLYTYTEYTQRKLIPTKTFKEWSDKTNILSYLGVHYIDAIYFITNANPKKVMATGQKVFLESIGIDTFDSIQCNVIWETKNGLLFNQTLMCSWVESNLSSAMSSQNINLIFSKGRINCEQKERGISILNDESALEHINPDFCRQYSQEDFLTFEGYGIDAYINYLHLIAENKLFINDRRLCNFHEGCISTSVIDAAEKSLNNNSSWVNILN